MPTILKNTALLMTRYPPNMLPERCMSSASLISTAADKAPCSGCGRAHQPIHNRKPRTWRHLDFFQFAASVHAEVPRVRCSGCKTTAQVKVPGPPPGRYLRPGGQSLLFYLKLLAIDELIIFRAHKGAVVDHLFRYRSHFINVRDSRLLLPLLNQCIFFVVYDIAQQPGCRVP